MIQPVEGNVGNPMIEMNSSCGANTKTFDEESDVVKFLDSIATATTSERPLQYSLSGNVELRRFFTFVGILWHPITNPTYTYNYYDVMGNLWFILIRLVVLAYVSIALIFMIYEYTQKYNQGDITSTRFGADLTLFISGGLAGISLLISSSNIEYHMDNKVASYLLPLLPQCLGRSILFTCACLSVDITGIGIASVIYQQKREYGYLLAVPFLDIGISLLLSGVFAFVLVDIKAAEKLIKSLEKLHESMTLKQYDIVREEMESRERASMYVNGLTLVIVFIGTIAVSIFAIVTQLGIANIEDANDAKIEWLKVGLSLTQYVKLLLFLLLVCFHSANVNDQADELMTNTKISRYTKGGDIYVALYMMERPLSFKIANYRMTTMEVLWKAVALIVPLISNTVKTLVVNQ